MALTEGAAAAVLTAQANRKTIGQQGGKSQSFGIGPVDPGSFFNGLQPLLQQACQFGVQGKVLWNRIQFAGEGDEFFAGKTGFHDRMGVIAVKTVPVFVKSGLGE